MAVSIHKKWQIWGLGWCVLFTNSVQDLVSWAEELDKMADAHRIENVSPVKFVAKNLAPYMRGTGDSDNGPPCVSNDNKIK